MFERLKRLDLRQRCTSIGFSFGIGIAFFAEILRLVEGMTVFLTPAATGMCGYVIGSLRENGAEGR